jgi:hypothetical protein
VSGDEDSGDGDWVEVFGTEAADNYGSRVADVAGGDLFGGERLCDGNGAVEVVGVGGAEAGDGAASLGPGGGKFRVGVDDATDLGELAVEESVGVEIAGGAKVPIDDLAVEVGDDEVFGLQSGVVDSAGLDDDEGLRAAAIDT